MKRDITPFLALLGDVPVVTDPEQVRRRSRDMTAHFSPVMKQDALEHVADLVVRPRDKADVLRVAAAAASARMPLLMRGAGTCNFGQGIPLHGGALVDMTALKRVLWTRPGAVRAEAGARLQAIDEVTGPQGGELRMHASTRRVATIGGYIGGGHAGVGSCTWGILRDRGNILGMEVVSIEEQPRTVQLTGDCVNLVHHAYGSNGIVTEVEMPLAPAWPWREHLVVFPAFEAALRFAQALASSAGLPTKLISVMNARTIRLLQGLRPFGDEGCDGTVLTMVAEPFAASFAALVAEFGGRISAQAAEGRGPWNSPLYEFSWGHARQQAERSQPGLVTTIGLYLEPDAIGAMLRTHRRLGQDAGMHFEVKRFDGQLGFQGMPLFAYRDAAHLAGVMRGMADDGAQVANNHTFGVREGGMKPIDAQDAAFKQAMDPYGLMNPGKLGVRADADAAAVAAGADLPTAGWRFRAGQGPVVADAGASGASH
ncbi:FAD-binding oxidoreductase [Ramlibacter sp. AW1]|uniref:FAD-binding oxidoreductase n=1 Tax=Ramlibacter aurantiacus TaxID=2801330 RepID=A0A936ZUL9_9BURK|nr:FAD-binding oxidoreductase [Ramlibacter aurantiacus]MBL0420884.1 FAD-binding oxidoreductase [Ramlibacter aurantiacus]